MHNRAKHCIRLHNIAMQPKQSTSSCLALSCKLLSLWRSLILQANMIGKNNNQIVRLTTLSRSSGGGGEGGEDLVFQVGYHLHRKNHVYFPPPPLPGEMHACTQKVNFDYYVHIDFLKKYSVGVGKHIFLVYFNCWENMCLGCFLKLLLWRWYSTWNTSVPLPLGKKQTGQWAK